MASSSSSTSGVDHTVDLPDELLSHIFHFLDPVSRNCCSLVCRRWLAVDAPSRHRLQLHASSGLATAVPALLRRFSAVSDLTLSCNPSDESIGDRTLALIASHCPNLTRLSIRSCTGITGDGTSAMAAACSNLRTLSIRRLSFCTDAVRTAAAASSLRSIRLEELHNGQCLVPLIANSPNLEKLILIRCSGHWDPLLQEMSARGSPVKEIHLEKVHVSAGGLAALATCANLETVHVEAGQVSVVELAPWPRGIRRIPRCYDLSNLAMDPFVDRGGGGGGGGCAGGKRVCRR